MRPSNISWQVRQSHIEAQPAVLLQTAGHAHPALPNAGTIYNLQQHPGQGSFLPAHPGSVYRAAFLTRECNQWNAQANQRWANPLMQNNSALWAYRGQPGGQQVRSGNSSAALPKAVNLVKCHSDSLTHVLRLCVWDKTSRI